MSEHASAVGISILFERMAGAAPLKFFEYFRALTNWFRANFRQMIPLSFPDFLAQGVGCVAKTNPCFVFSLGHGKTIA
jgi:hypothetical protein